MSAIRFQDYTIEPVYRKLTKHLRNEIVVFWLENGALADIHQARQRVDQVAFVVRNQEEDVVGISTVYSAPYGEDGALFLNYRMFIHPDHRVAGMMRAVTKATRCFFNDNQPLRETARGMIICTENRKLMRPGMREVFQRSVWNYVGKDQRGFDVWMFRFDS